jgi:hypothetical protein
MPRNKYPLSLTLTGPNGFVSILVEIPVYSCGFWSIPVDSGPIPVDSGPFLRIPVHSCGFQVESVGE